MVGGGGLWFRALLALIAGASITTAESVSRPYLRLEALIMKPS
jgi:hypothetical protein